MYANHPGKSSYISSRPIDPKIFQPRRKKCAQFKNRALRHDPAPSRAQLRLHASTSEVTSLALFPPPVHGGTEGGVVDRARHRGGVQAGTSMPVHLAQYAAWRPFFRSSFRSLPISIIPSRTPNFGLTFRETCALENSRFCAHFRIDKFANRWLHPSPRPRGD